MTGHRARWLPAGLVIGVLLLALPLSQVPPWPEDFGPTTAKRVAEIELAGRWLGTTSTADFVPMTVETIPRPEPTLEEDFRAEQPLDRVNRATLPPGTTVKGEEVTLLHQRYHVSGTTDFPLRLFQYAFPGWRAEVDGETVAIELGRPEGFIVVPIPAGDHTVDVVFGGTPARNLAAAVSGISLLLVLAGAVYFSRHPQPAGSEAGGARFPDSSRVVWAVAGAAVAVGLLNALIIEPVGLLRYESQPFEAIPAGEPASVDFGSQIALIGYDLPPGPLEPGDEADVRLYWQAQQPQDINYQVFLHLARDDGTLVAQSDKLNPGDFPTKRWPLDKYVRDEHRLILPQDVPPGDYRLSVGLWVAEDGWRLPILNADGQQVGDHFLLPEVIHVESGG